MAITPDGQTALVTSTLNGTVSVLDLSEPINYEQKPPTLKVKFRSHGVAITLDGQTALVVANYIGGTVSVLDLSKPINYEQNPPTIPVGQAFSNPGEAPAAVAIAPDGQTALVPNFAEGNTVDIIGNKGR